MIEVVSATPHHVSLILPLLTEASRRELEAFGDPEPTLLRSVERSYAYTALVQGSPIAMAGGAPHKDGASVWMVVTEGARRFPKCLHRRCQDVLDTLLVLNGSVHTFVDSRNTVGLRWVRSLGFALSLPLYGDGEVFFHRAELRR